MSEEERAKALDEIGRIIAPFDGHQAFSLAMEMLARVLVGFRVPDNDPEENLRCRQELLAAATPVLWAMIAMLDSEVKGHA